jgi:hypothetical protein
VQTDKQDQRLTFVSCSGRENSYTCQAFISSGPKNLDELRRAQAAGDGPAETNLFWRGVYIVRLTDSGAWTAILDPKSAGGFFEKADDVIERG